MTHPVTALYPGTFDPLTLGHWDMIERALRLFPNLIIAVAKAHHKQTLFTLEERLLMVRTCVAHYPQVRVEPFSGLLVDFAREHGALAVVRGIRSVTDLDFEAQLAGMNRALTTEMETIFLTPDSRYQHISSTIVREIARLGGDVTQFVPPSVLPRLLEKVR
jgi:pantetheine-phosphate adenylyltransferase